MTALDEDQANAMLADLRSRAAYERARYRDKADTKTIQVSVPALEFLLEENTRLQTLVHELTAHIIAEHQG